MLFRDRNTVRVRCGDKGMHANLEERWRVFS